MSLKNEFEFDPDTPYTFKWLGDTPARFVSQILLENTLYANWAKFVILTGKDYSILD